MQITITVPEVHFTCPDSTCRFYKYYQGCTKRVVNMVIDRSGEFRITTDEGNGVFVGCECQDYEEVEK